jgi:hypothetical protein
MLQGLGAVRINEQLIASERVGTRSFKAWGTLLAALGPQRSLRRRVGLIVYIIFLLSLIVTVVPITALLKRLLSPLTQKRIKREKAYFAAPSGE